MNEIQQYQFEPEGTLEEEDDSDCFEESGIVEETSSRSGNTDWCLFEFCEPLDPERESLCCHSLQKLNCILADSNVKCISQHPECLRY